MNSPITFEYTLRLLTDLSAEDLDRLYFIKREKVNDVIAFINAIIKTRYDSSYKVITL